MKTLQDYIYESILDDEEVLINDTEKSLSNPFVMIMTIINNSSNAANDYRSELEVKKIFNKYILDTLPYEIRSKIRIRISTGLFRVFCSNDSGNEELILATNNSLEAAKELNTHKGDKTAVLFLDAKAFRKLVTDCYNFKNVPDYHNWVKYIVTKYKLNKSTDKYVYTI